MKINNNLVDISTVKVDKSLPRHLRHVEFVRQVKNPYNFSCHGREVTVGFSGANLSLEECIMGIFF